VVKIQYPGVAEAIRGDLANVALISRMAGMLYPNADLKPVVEELRDRITEELDYGIEARNQRTFGERYAGHPFVRVPRVIDACSTARVLTSEYTPGRRFAEVRGDPPERRSHWGEILYRFLMGSIQQRMFNGDPHPGNYLFDDEGRVIFLDFGCVKFFPEPMWKAWRAMVVAHLERDPARFRQRAVGLGFLAEDSALDERRLYDYFGVFYEPIKEDQPFTFTREYNERCVRTTLRPDGPLAGMEKLLNLPRDFALVNRINLGMYAILSDLGATANFHRVHREYLWGGEPSTELGAKERAWRKLPP